MDDDSKELNVWFALSALFYIASILIFIAAGIVESRYPGLYVIVEPPGWFCLVIALILTAKGSLE